MKHKAGETVMVYEDPLTEEIAEGQATLLRFVREDPELGETWIVAFEGDDAGVEVWRRILAK